MRLGTCRLVVLAIFSASTVTWGQGIISYGHAIHVPQLPTVKVPTPAPPTRPATITVPRPAPTQSPFVVAPPPPGTANYIRSTTAAPNVAPGYVTPRPAFQPPSYPRSVNLGRSGASYPPPAPSQPSVTVNIYIGSPFYPYFANPFAFQFFADSFAFNPYFGSAFYQTPSFLSPLSPFSPFLYSPFYTPSYFGTPFAFFSPYFSSGYALPGQNMFVAAQGGGEMGIPQGLGPAGEGAVAEDSGTHQIMLRFDSQ